MLEWLAPALISEAQLQALEESGQRAPDPAQRYSREDIARLLLCGRWLAFSCPGGCFAVERQGDRLHVVALNIKGFGWIARQFRDWLDKLATDLKCDTVQTICFDERLAKAMMKIEAKPEAWQLVWKVKGREHGQ